MDTQMVNNILFAVIGVLVIIVISLLANRSKILNRETDFILELGRERVKVINADADKSYAETELKKEQDKLEKIHLLRFASWLFNDEEFVSVISSKVDELRPAALDRYNAKQQEELRLRAEADAAAMKRSQEYFKKSQEEAEARKVSSGTFTSDGAMIAVSTDATSTFSGGDSCSVDSSC